jgi:hypothetical protein
MKILYASLAVATIMLSGCQGFWADFFNFKSEAQLDSDIQDLKDARRMAQEYEQECVRAKLTRGFVMACGRHNNDEGDRDRKSMQRSDRRLKRDVVQVGALPSGIPLYEFNYIWGGPRYIGVMAQDVLKVMPEAVSVDEYGFYRVDYSMIGARMVLAEDQPRPLFAQEGASHVLMGAPAQ